jgi:hypothetical protein
MGSIFGLVMTSHLLLLHKIFSCCIEIFIMISYYVQYCTFYCILFIGQANQVVRTISALTGSTFCQLYGDKTSFEGLFNLCLPDRTVGRPVSFAKVAEWHHQYAFTRKLSILGASCVDVGHWL